MVQLLTESFFGEPKMALLWDHCENTLFKIPFLSVLLAVLIF